MDNKKKLKAKANANRVAAYALSGVMLASMIPYNVFAEMTGTEKATIQAAKELDISSPKIDEAVRETPKKQASDEFTEAKAKENWDQELKDKGYWKLAQGQRFRRVSASDPVSIYDINYDGTFVDAEGDTNLRFTYNELNGVGSGVWHRIVVNFGDLADKIDFGKSYAIGEDGKTKESFYDLQGQKGLDITKLYSGPRAGKRVNFPMNIVLKDGKTLNDIPKENYTVQLRLTNKEGNQIYTYAPKGTSIDYSSYTKVTSVDLSDNISTTVLEGPKQEKGERIAIQRSFMSEFIANPVEYDDSTQIGILRTEYLGKRGGSIGENIKDVDGKPIGFAQVFDAKLVKYLKEDANGNVAYTNVLTNNRKQGSWVKKIGIKNGDINVKNGLAYVVISRLDSVNAFKNNGINAVGVPTLDQYINQSGIYFSAIDYLIDKTELNEEFSPGKRKTDFSMAAGWVEPNTKGWTIFEKKFDEEFVVPKGEKYTINTTNVPEGGQVIIQVGDKNQAILRNKQGYYNSTVSSWNQGIDSVDETSPGTYEFTLREGATIKKGEGIRVLLPDTPDHTSPVSFVNQHNADGGTELKVESNSGNIKVTPNNSAGGKIVLKYTLKDQDEQHEIVYTKKGLLWKKEDPDNILEGAEKAWITKSKLEPGTEILVEHYDASGRKVDGLESYIIYKELEKSPERYTNIAWVDSTDTLSEVSMRKSLYKPYQVIFTNDYVENSTDDFYKDPRVIPTDGQDFMKNTDKVQGFTKYEGGSIRMRTELIDGEGLLGKVTATENEYNEKDGSLVKDNSEKLTLEGKEYNAYRYIIDLNNLGKISKEGIATRDTEETTETKGEKLVLKKDKKLYFNASDGSSLGSELVKTRVRTRVLFDATDGAFEGDKKKEVKIVPDNVKYLDDDGYVASGFTGDNVQAGTGDAFPEAPAAEGKTFLGWVTEEGKTALGGTTVKSADFNKLAADKKFTAETPVTTHQVVYAIYTDEKLVTFDANGGKFADGSTTKTDDITDGVQEPDAPKQDGKTFVGWASTKDATKAEEGILDNVTEAKTVYAVWKDGAQETSAKPTITAPKAGDTSVSGTGVAGAKVVLKDKDGNKIGEATVDKDGNWTVDNIPKDKLVEGEKVTAEQTEAGKKPATEEATVAKAQETSAKPTITEPKAGDTSVSGTGVPGATVVLKDKDGKEIGKATVDKDGNWTVKDIPADKLVEGEKVTAEQTEAGKKPASEEATVAKTPEEKTATPTVTAPKAGDKEIKGTAPAGSDVTVTLPDGTEIKTKADDKGNWTATVPADKKLAENDEIKVVAKDGDKQPSEEAKATVGAKAPTPGEDDKTKVTGEVKPVDPTDEKQGTGISVENPDKDTKVTAKDEDGKDVPVTINPNTGEVQVTPGTNVDGPIVVTIEDPDLPGGKTTIIIDVVGHSMLRDDNGNGYIGENGYNPDNDYYIFPGGIVEHDYTPTYPVKTVVPEKTQAVTPVRDTLWYVFHINEYEYEVVRNGVVTKRLMDVTPVLRNNRTMLPLRYVAEAIGADVKWDAKTRTATFTKDGLTASIQVDGNEIVLSNGKTIKMDSKPLMLNNRVLVSVVNVANVFGLTNGNTLDGSDQDIEWQQEDKSATIYIRR